MVLFFFSEVCSTFYSRDFLIFPEIKITKSKKSTSLSYFQGVNSRFLSWTPHVTKDHVSTDVLLLLLLFYLVHVTLFDFFYQFTLFPLFHPS